MVASSENCALTRRRTSDVFNHCRGFTKRAASRCHRLMWLLVFLVSGCTESNPSAVSTAEGRTSAKLSLNWYPEAEHGGYVAAKTLGIFDAARIEMEIVPGGPGAPTTIIAELAAGRTQFAISDADNVVKARATGLPIVAVLAPLQNSPRCIMVHEKSGIFSESARQIPHEPGCDSS